MTTTTSIASSLTNPSWSLVTAESFQGSILEYGIGATFVGPGNSCLLLSVDTHSTEELFLTQEYTSGYDRHAYYSEPGNPADLDPVQLTGDGVDLSKVQALLAEYSAPMPGLNLISLIYKSYTNLSE
jgi:hypothetical protein